MYPRLSLIALPLATYSWAHPTNSLCKEVQIPVSVAATRFIIDTTVENDWDAVSLTFNLTRRDGNDPSVPSPIVGKTPSPVQSNFTIGATLCGNGSTVLVLTHGIIESKLYWRPTFDHAKEYSFIDAAVAAGYSVLSYDRIGVGSSSTVDSIKDAQYQVETAVLDELVAYARKSMKAAHVALIGHSYGSYIAAGSANHTAVDAVVMMAFSGRFDWFSSFLTGAGFRVANKQNPKRWGHLDSGYLTTSDLYATTYIYFKDPFFEHRAAEWTHNVAAEPFAVGELLSLTASYDNYNNVTAPVLVLQGKYDVASCGGNCVGIVEEGWLRDNTFGNAKVIEAVGDLPAGHNVNLHKGSQQAFQKIFDFFETQGI